MENKKTKQLIAAGVFLAVLELLIFILWYISSDNSAFSLLNQDWFERNLFLYLTIVSALAAFFLSLALFLILTIRSQASSLADKRLKGLLDSREMFLKLYESAPVAYLLVSPKGLVHFPNKAALRLFGRVADDLDGKPLVDFVEESYREHVHVLIGRIKSGSGISDEEIQIVRPSGERRFVLLSIFPLKAWIGQGENGLVNLIDITRQKQVDKVKTEFVSLASHQLRTPLSAIKWYAELLVQGDAGDLSAIQLRYIQKMQDGNERMIKLVNTLLNVSRMELGTLIVDKERVQIIDIVDSVLEEMHSQITERKQQVVRDIDSALPPIDTDPKLFRIIIQNLISNASKYTPPGGRITVSLQKMREKLTLKIIDTGIGIPEDQQEKIFTKLFRGSNATKVSVDGVGLGLYIVKSVVETLGGSISFESKEGSGTTFTVSLPI